MPLPDGWWERVDNYPGMPPRCRCGHGSGSHEDEGGRCCRGHYDDRGKWRSEGCGCLRFRDERIGQTDLFDELLADAEPPRA